jgi:signal peptidase II
LRILFVSFFIILLDQVTKFLIKGLSIPSIGLYIEGIPYRSSINVIGEVLQITYIENPGMAFGLELGSKMFLSIFTVFATFLILYFIFRNRREPFYIRFALAMIFGGAVGNLIDRLFYGMIYGYAPLFYGNVVDFIHVNTPDFTIFGKMFYSFPIFNIADMAVSIGFVLILFGYNKIFKHQNDFDPEVLAGGGIIVPEYKTETIITETVTETVTKTVIEEKIDVNDKGDIGNENSGIQKDDEDKL